MRAWVLHSVGDIRYEEVKLPAPEPGEALIRVEAAGVCGSDIPRIYHTGAHRMPLIPGHEFSGVVDTVGSGVDKRWQGSRVGVFPLIPCRKCGPCKSGHPEMCRNYDYVGSRRDGAFAEYVTVPADNLIKLPDAVSFEEAAMLEPMAVAVHAMRMAVDGSAKSGGQCRNKVGKGAAAGISETSDDAQIVVCGLGTIGLLLTMFLLERGFRNVYVIGNKEGQYRRCSSLGLPCENYCDSSRTDMGSWLKERIGGADIFFECVGKNECVKLGIDSAAPGGKVILVGNPYSDMNLPRDVYWKILRDQLTLKGTWNSSFLGPKLMSESSIKGSENGEPGNVGPDMIEAGPSATGPVAAADDWDYVIERLSSGRVRPEGFITHRLPLEELDRGFAVMRDKTEDYCKVMMAV